jgi:hypothetical protein
LLCTAGNAERSHTASWGSLHEDLLTGILANLSLVELARISRTCRSFKAVYGRLMVAQQKSRRDLAVKLFGRERITCLLALITYLLKWEPSPSDISEEVERNGWISADGVLHMLPPDDLVWEFMTKAGDITLSLVVGVCRDNADVFFREI